MLQNTIYSILCSRSNCRFDNEGGAPSTRQHCGTMCCVSQTEQILAYTEAGAQKAKIRRKNHDCPENEARQKSYDFTGFCELSVKIRF
jgi:hypothetical protein